jgi:hypothetical protein
MVPLLLLLADEAAAMVLLLCRSDLHAAQEQLQLLRQ